tara:strand:+ start:308 stop:1468 length:1161 start_codon:yes stop_codon:yes gene_type:complete
MDIPREAIELSYERELVQPKRRLGNGRWDMALKEALTRLSNADNYEDAKLEWLATGNVWWSQYGGDRAEDAPLWVMNSSMGYGSCLCGHRIIYHFEIENTENGRKECVGSDHINSYLILRAIKEATGLEDEYITDEMIDQWINVRIEGMKKTAWWATNGSIFEFKFNKIKDLDLRVNVRSKGFYWDEKLNTHRPKTYIRKRAMDGEMASIVWRWNHPDNHKAQINTKGYPNKKLLEDLDDFYYSSRVTFALVAEVDANMEKKMAEVDRIREKKYSRNISNKMEFFGISNYYEVKNNLPFDDWTTNFLRDIEIKLKNSNWGNSLSQRQIETLTKCMEAATSNQIQYMQNLGYNGSEKVTKRQATVWISANKGDGLNSHDKVNKTEVN